MYPVVPHFPHKTFNEQNKNTGLKYIVSTRLCSFGDRLTQKI